MIKQLASKYQNARGEILPLGQHLLDAGRVKRLFHLQRRLLAL